MKSHLYRNEGINSISAILELSYHNLPPELKACFLCLGFFKEDAVIKAKYLVYLWVAQGLVAQEEVGEEETMEDVATDYLKQLISRNMVQVKSGNYDVVKECQMHDLLRDLSQRKAKEEMNLEILMREEGNSHHSSRKPRHRVIYDSGTRLVSSGNRTLLIHTLSVVVPSSYLKSLELLRFLDLRNVKLKVFPKAIGSLTGLRYFKMRYYGGGSKLPRPWAKLTNLQVLDLRGGMAFILIDKVILKMKSLHHLYARISYRSKVPRGDDMKKLQTFTLFRLEESNVWQIQGMAGVSTLGFDMYDMSDATELFTHLATLGNLVSLSLEFLWRPLNLDGFSALHHITQLKMKFVGDIERLPTNLPPNISHFTLSRPNLVEDPMPVLERLPELLYLKMYRAYKGEKMVISHQGFPKLKVLRLESMFVRNIQVEKGGVPELKQLFIYDCRKLNIKRLPRHLKSAIIEELIEFSVNYNVLILY